MTTRTSPPRPLAPIGRTEAWVLLALGCLAALSAAGPAAAGACVAGGVVTGLAFRVMASGTAALVARAGEADARPRSAALLAFVLRHAAVGTALYVLVVPLRMPAAWMLVGASAWPVGCLAGATRTILAGAPPRREAA